MYTTLMPGAIGITDLSFEDSVAFAAKTGFAGITLDIRAARAMADEQGIDAVKGLFASHGIRAATWGPPVNWHDDEKRDQQLEELPRYAEVAQALGSPGATTGLMPGSNERTFDEEYAFVLERLRPLAQKLKECGTRLGIEFIAPKTTRNRFKHEFIYDAKGMMALANDIGTGNVGLLFDLWHHYEAHGTVEEIEQLKAEDIVFVHVNDAPAGIPVDEQMDLVRTLPMETGVIEGPAMMRALAKIGYDGPVAAEPFSQRISDLAKQDPVAAATETRESIEKLFAAAGI